MSVQKIRVIGTKMSKDNTIEVPTGTTWGEVKEILEEKGLINENMKALCSKTNHVYEDTAEALLEDTTAILTSTKMSNAGI